ncbi:MAG: hypothetical protein OQK04_05945 [Kangiellaceae bacterium]|nr:hypothetical protein [Kangiellaceae bacterium]
MELKIELINDFVYSASGTSIPLRVILTSDQNVLIDSNVNINRLELYNSELEYFSFGINRNITSVKTSPINLSPNEPYSTILDLLDEDNFDEEDEVLKGNYIVKATVTVYVYDKLGHIKANVVELEEEVNVKIAE